MNEKHVTWKRTEEQEINLLELLCQLCRQWKQIAVCAIVFACLIGGYKTLSSQKTVSVTEQVKTAQESLTVNEQQRVDAALELSEGVQEQEDYLSESVLMGIDPARKDRVSMLYSVEKAKRSDRQKILEAYMNYISSRRMAERVQKSNQSLWDMELSYISELIAVSQKTESGNQIVITETEQNLIMQITLAGRDAEMTEALSKVVQEGIAEYQSDVRNEVGAHELKLISVQQSVMADNDLAVRQNEKRVQLSTALQNLKTIVDTFTEQQKLVYNEQLDADTAKSVEKDAEQAVSGGISIKWVVLGLFGGICVYCAVFLCWYLLRGTVKSVDELKRQYTFPVFGGITLKKGSSGLGEDLSGKEKDAYERERAQLLNRIRLACRTQEIRKLCIATDFSFAAQDKGLLSAARKQLQDWGIEVIFAENAAGNVAVWDELTETDAVLMLCKLDVTTHRVIDEEMQFYLENDLQVLGAAVLECR